MQRFLHLFAVGLAAVASVVHAEPSAGEVEVSAVRFKLMRPAVGGEAWLEAEVGVNARPLPGNAGHMPAQVRVELVIATERARAEGRPQGAFYRASASAVALPAGVSRVRFYLPPEIVRRDAVRGEPRRWRAEAVAVDERMEAEERVRFSSGLTTAEERVRFEREAKEAGKNDGILQPQYLTPFAWEYPTRTPSFVRGGGE